MKQPAKTIIKGYRQTLGYFPAVCLLISLLQWGCMFSAAPNRSKERFMEQVFMTEISPPAMAPGEFPEGKISFGNALELAVKQDENLALIYYTWQKDAVDLSQAKSMLFPRLLMRLSNETHYSQKDNELENHSDTGLQVEYNFLNLLMQRDAISVEKAIEQQSILRGRMGVRDVYSRLLLLALRVEGNKKTVALAEKALGYARDGAAFARKLAEEGRIKPGEVWKWNNTLQRTRETFHEAREQLFNSQSTLNRMVGGMRTGDIEITGARDHLPGAQDHITAPEQEQERLLLKQAWTGRPEVKLAELDLFLAEMKLMRTKLSWLKYFRLSLGVGRFHVMYEDDEQSAIRVNTSIAIPLLDLGDHRRLKKKARLNREMARMKVVKTARNISREIRGAMTDVKRRRRKLANRKDMLQQARQQKDMIEDLLRLNQAELTDLYEARLAALEAEAKLIKAAFESEKARLNLEKTRGSLFNHHTAEKLFKHSQKRRKLLK